METSQPKTQHICEVCGKTLSSKNRLQNHKKIHEKRPRPFLCELCQNSFLTESSFNSHKLVHLKKSNVHCKICKDSFRTEQCLRKHLDPINRERKFECFLCEFVTNTAKCIRIHQETNHPYTVPENTTLHQVNSNDPPSRHEEMNMDSSGNDLNLYVSATTSSQF
ncbi:unnamed protein product [Caenorhabditis sp. 36 PRJEB53466]|nr:unnamed protein product [Caenorhabditis sp. 36 PRJEB53466]